MRQILYVANYQQGVGGISVQVDYLQKYLATESGYESALFSTKGTLWQRLILFFKLLKVAANYDVIHIHGCSYRGFLPVVYGVIAGKFHHKKIIVTYHGGGADAFLKKYSKIVLPVLRKADYVVVLSGYLHVIFNKYGIQTQVIPNIMDCKKPLFRNKKKIDAHFISVRHLRALYNVPCILHAFQQVKNTIPEATLTILGDGDQKTALMRWVAEQKLEGVNFVGQVANTEIYNYLLQNDIFLSAPKEDNMPVSVLEAFEAGLLIISSKVGGIPYMIKHRQTGLLFQSDNYIQLAEEMLWAIRHQQETLQIINSAHLELEQYRWKSIRIKILALYDE